MSSHGILHQSSCAYSPQQNGVAERKNHYLIETARTLLLHPKVPQRIWGDAILVACYLINRPFCMIRSLILSFFVINLSFAFLMFLVVSVLFILLLLGKLFAKATKCVFLGYSRLQRGYRCYSTDTNRYFIFADVTFFEGSSFFSSEERPHVSNVLHVVLSYHL